MCSYGAAGAGFFIQEAPPTTKEVAGLALTCVGLTMWTVIKRAGAQGNSSSSNLLPDKGAADANRRARRQHALRQVLQLLLPVLAVGFNMFAVRLIATGGGTPPKALSQQPSAVAAAAGGVWLAAAALCACVSSNL